MKKIIIILLALCTITTAYADRKVTANLANTSTLEGYLRELFGLSSGVLYANEPYNGEPLIITARGYHCKDIMGGTTFKVFIKLLDCRDITYDMPQYGTYNLLGVGGGEGITIMKEFRIPLMAIGNQNMGATIPFAVPTLKLLHIPKGLTGLGTDKFGATSDLETVYMDVSTAFATTIFDNVKANVTVYVPEEGLSSYQTLWTGYKEIKTRRKVIFHPIDNDLNNRVSFTYDEGNSDGAQLYYWYSNVGELMEVPQLESTSVNVDWYADPQFNTKWNFDSNVVPASADAPTPLHLYGKVSAAKQYYTVKLYWNDSSKAEYTETVVEESEPVATLVPPNPSKRGHFFMGWYDNAEFTGTAFDRGNNPSYDEETGATILDGVIPLASDLTLYAKWESKPWLYNPLLIEIPEGGTLQTAFAAAYATRTEHTDKPITDIYGIVSLEIRGTVNGDAIANPGGSAGWYTQNLRDKVVSLDLREAHTGLGWATYFEMQSLLQEIKLPVDGNFTTPGDAFHMTYSVQKIYFPTSLTSLGGAECSAPFSYTPLTDLYIDAPAPPSTTGGLWHSFAGGTTIYVPEGAKALYEAETWSDGNCRWLYQSPEEGGSGVSLNNTIVERPKVTFHTDGGTRPLYAYTDADHADTYYWYVNADSAAYNEAPEVTKANHDFDGWYTDADFTTPYAGTPVALGQGGLDLYAKWIVRTPTGIVPGSANDAIVSSVYYTLHGIVLCSPPATSGAAPLQRAMQRPCNERCSAPATSGVYIRKDMYASGKIKATKVFVNK